MTENNTDRLAALSAAGVAVWLDDLSRDRITSGNLEKMRDEQHVVGVTTNPSIFANALAKGTTYGPQLADLARRKLSVEESSRVLTTWDVRAAADILRPVFDASNGTDGRVSIEVDPRLAHDTETTVAEAKYLWWAVDRPNVLIKIPATLEGLPAITAVLAEGISVNVTLIFGLERYKAVMDAFFTGLEQAKANGHDLSTIESVASFFVSRVDTEIDKRLEKLGSPEALALRGKAGVANARLAYQAYEEAFSSDRWKALAAAGARPQRPLWASTGVKNPDYSDVLYVEGLIAPGVVNTMPEATLRAFEDHGDTPGDTVTGTYAESREVLDALAGLGVEYDDVIDVLEREGVEKFEVSWNELLATISAELDKA
ncbi:transaldolase [Actinorhabdospora filicis]|uniref:Transaldolase n=1 Tax=Actinorhabdospora filicis TaxID=1785913 RepID=A0A9W6SN56_9ACTN|nr:transaldolase [Actinorhabdospora filicis]GLZ78924.1 transaldolase [Actinorhabdospora filicis]